MLYGNHTLSYEDVNQIYCPKESDLEVHYEERGVSITKWSRSKSKGCKSNRICCFCKKLEHDTSDCLMLKE